MLKYVIRTCVPGDERALSMIGQATILETYAPFVRGDSLYEYMTEELGPERFRSFLADGSMRLWAAELEPTRCITGYAHVMPDEHDPSAIELKRLYLLHRFRGEGMGKRLMDESLAFAHEKGAQAVLLRVHHRNEDAIGFYLGYGFQTIGQETFHSADERSTVLVMRLELTKAAR